MAWTGGITRAQGDLVTAAIWNAHLGASGDLDHLHEGLHIVAEKLTHVSGSIWQTSSNYRAGKWLGLFWNFVPIPLPAGSGYFSESAANQITFSSTMKTNLNGGNDTSATDIVIAVYIKSE